MLASGTPLSAKWIRSADSLSTALTVLRDRLFNPEPDVQAAALGALKLTEAFEDLQQIYHST